MALKTYNKPDLHCPKMCDSVLTLFNKEFYEGLWKKYPHLRKYSGVQVKAMIKGFNRDAISYTVLNTRGGVKLPSKLGHVFLGVTKIRNNEIVDAATSGELEKEVHHSNYHTDGYIGKIYYSNLNNDRRDFLNGEYWSFMPERSFSRAVKPVLIKDWKKYVVITYPRDITRVLNQAKKVKIQNIVINKNHADYDEFKFDN